MNELFLAVDPGLEAAPYQQIVDQLRAFVERGELRPGDPLPTVRQLAGDLGVAPNTVARAYAELQEEGWLASEGRRGTRVASHAPAHDKRIRARLLREAVVHFFRTLAHRGYSEDEVAAALQQVAKR
ncbi:MAG: GntR family transcriptional regulator [Vulcanimicrobiaceae bacterium]